MGMFNSTGPSVYDDVGLSYGLNRLTVTVTAVDGITKKIYTVDIYRIADTNANLDSLIVSAGNLMPAFHPDTLRYRDTVPIDSLGEVRIRVNAASGKATLSVSGEDDWFSGNTYYLYNFQILRKLTL